ncbi:hypothetical protein JZ751_003742 [Albula glossodonta]|uniref:Phosphatidylinositol 5-phosphate 4-kinase type-2 alpha n=1 Tax=Albula glossodonta TaxID=121402 RepID=A0A8T2PE09_9TELE|nr:hypothetical protein JZ751_003742 [Albula glossodonta]
MYRLTVDGDETYMIVTRNVFSHRLSVYKKYDLKGSTVAREASDKEKQPRPPEEATPPKSRMQQKLQTIRIATRFYCAIRNFLAQLKLMDYSLLVGIHDVERAEQEEVESEENEGDEEGENSPRKEVYFMAIIDILTHYDAKKKAAHAAKTVKHGAGAEISTVNPEQYSKRFYDFITTILS